jgi:DegV family protein with EDD domain
MMEARFVITEIVPLPEEVKSECGIIQYANPISIDGKEYLDNQLPFSLEEFSEMLLSEAHVMETSVTPPPVYKEIYESVPAEIPIFAICFSRKISAFCDSALAAAEDFKDRDITVIRTRFCPPVMTLWAILAARVAEETDSADELRESVTAMGDRMGVYHALFSLKYLRQTGRISAAKAFLGGMMKIVPIITCSEDGMIVPAGKGRRIEKSLDKVCDFLERDMTRMGGSTVDFLYAYTGEEENVRVLMEKVKERFTVGESFLYRSGYCMHRYLGPNAAGFAYYVRP